MVLGGQTTQLEDIGTDNQFKGAPPFSPTIDCVEIFAESWYQVMMMIIVM